MEYNADIDVKNLDEFKDFKLFFYYTSLGNRSGHSMLTAGMNRQTKLNLDIRDKDGNTMLHHACQNCQRKFPKEVFKFLIDCGADVNAVNNNMETPLHLVCSSKDLTSLLLRHNAQLDRVDRNGYTPLMLACQQKENAFGMITMLLASGTKVNGATRTSETPLHVACTEGFMKVVNLLVFVGADVNCENEKRVTPLMIAFRQDNGELACFLIENGARVDNNLAREINQKEWSLLDLAFHSKSVNAMCYLLSVGARLTEKCNYIDGCLVGIWAKYPTAIKLLILSRCYVPEKEHLLWYMPHKTVEGQINHLILEFFIWCFEELGYEIGDIYNILQTYVVNTKQLAELA